jgi:hypothetical protein
MDVDELTNVELRTPLVTSGTGVDGVPVGQPLPSGLQPFDKFCCMAVNDDKMGVALI